MSFVVFYIRHQIASIADVVHLNFDLRLKVKLFSCNAFTIKKRIKVDVPADLPRVARPRSCIHWLWQSISIEVRCPALYCKVLYCTVLYCTVLYCTVLCCTVLYCTVLYCTVLYCTLLKCTVV